MDKDISLSYHPVQGCSTECKKGKIDPIQTRERIKEFQSQRVKNKNARCARSRLISEPLFHAKSITIGSSLDRGRRLGDS
jgi:hypothetical protein